MRSALGFAGLVTLLAIRTVSGQPPISPATTPAAQAQPTEMVVVAAEVEVRSGPNQTYYPTGKLFNGTRVQVMNVAEGWIGIKPPKGSVSWISADKVIRDEKTKMAAVIGTTPVAVRPAGLTKGMTPVELTKVPPGSIVVVVGNPETKDGAQWLPIEPVPSELRYLPAEALKPAQAAVIASQPPASPAQLLAEADQKVAAGNVPQAIQLYQQVVSMPNADGPQRVWAQNRLASLTGGTSTSAANPVGASPVNLTTRPTDGPRWSVWARLRRAAFEKDGQPAYVLENNRGEVLLYVTTGSGFTLRDYVGKTVALYGTIAYRDDGYVRTHFMTATHVATLPNN